MKNENKKFLIVVDLSYWLYVVIFGSVAEFKRRNPIEHDIWIKNPNDCDQANLPNILNSSEYKKILKQYVMKRLETIDDIAKQNFQNELDLADKIDIMFAQDDKLSHNFRTDLYPQYKAHRALVKKSFQVQTIKDYIVDVMFDELDAQNKFGYKLVKVDGAEGDDVIATALMNYKDNYIGTLLIASDRDFLQIDGIREFDLFGKEAKRILGDEEVSAEDFLLGKILMGDKSDNIKQVFLKCGPKTALKLTKDKNVLKNMLKESNESAKRFELNKKIISFKEMPTELSDKIKQKINEQLYSLDAMNEQSLDLSKFMEW